MSRPNAAAAFARQDEGAPGFDLDALRAEVQARVAEEEAAYGTAEAQEPGKCEKLRSFAFVPASDLISSPHPTRWLISGFLEEGSLATVFGPSGSMKSFVAVDMGLCIATGRNWHGKTVRNSGAVFYICGEGFAGVGKRLRVWMLHNGVDAAQVPFFVSNAPVQMLDPASVDSAMVAINELAEAHGAPRLIIIDTLARNFGPGDENNTPDMNAFVAALDTIQRQYECAILTVHHTGLATAERARGSSAFRAAMDWEFKLEPKADVRLLSCTKSKDHEPPQNMAFEPDAVETGWDDEDGNPVTSIVLQSVNVPVTERKNQALKGANKIALDALFNVCTKGDILKTAATAVDVETWRAEAYRLSISPSTEQSAKQKAFRRALMTLRDGGYVSVDSDMYWPTDLTRRKVEEKPVVQSVKEAEQLGLI